MKKTIQIACIVCLVLLMSVLMLTACNDPAMKDGSTQTTPTADEQETPTEEETTPTETEPPHVWSEWTMTKAPNCEKAGLAKRYCTECLCEESQPIDPLGHVEVIDEARDPTCYAVGLTKGKHCSECDKVLVPQMNIAIIAHNLVDGICTMCNCEVYDVTIWVSEKYGVEDQFIQQIQNFMEENPGIIINAMIQGVTEADAGFMIIRNPKNAPDIYCFAQDMLPCLVQSQALMAPEQSVVDDIIANNDKGSVAAATYNGTVYAYPMTSENGYYMYYDTSIISPEDAESLEALIAACEKNNKKFRFMLGNAWYSSSFFMATGCHSKWEMNAEGKFVAFDDTFNSANGLIAMKGMQKIVQSSCYDSDADIFTDAGVIVTGVWNKYAAMEHFGQNLGATDLPSFTVDGKSYHLGSYSGHKLMGVKPQTDAKKATVLSRLAEYLTSEACQLERFNRFEWCPSNLAAQQSEAVMADASMVALAKQNNYATPQPQFLGKWWDIAKTLAADAKAAKTDAELAVALATYEKTITDVFELANQSKDYWSIIGNICNTNWDTDIPLNKVSEGVWETDVLALEAGKEFKVRRNVSWDVNFGENGVLKGTNIVVKTTGNYKVRFTYDGTTASIELVPAN